MRGLSFHGIKSSRLNHRTKGRSKRPLAAQPIVATEDFLDINPAFIKPNNELTDLLIYLAHLCPPPHYLIHTHQSNQSTARMNIENQQQKKRSRSHSINGYPSRRKSIAVWRRILTLVATSRIFRHGRRRSREERQDQSSAAPHSVSTQSLQATLTITGLQQEVTSALDTVTAHGYLLSSIQEQRRMTPAQVCFLVFSLSHRPLHPPQTKCLHHGL
ncbi:hypothetical protein C8Q75DRAFT_742697 [Abortiporus biennis]|nr:hypothetical protein C8Q75DRAFT_742697 [Abortiporus biennis]